MTPSTSSSPSQNGRGRLGALAVQADPGKVVLSVKMRAGSRTLSSLSDVARTAAAHGGVQRRTLRQLGTVSLEVPSARADGVATQLRQRADVARVDVVQRRTLTFVPDDEQYSATAPYLDAVNAPSAWDVQRGDASVRIAVVDSGVDTAHPDLVGRVTDTYNAVDQSADVQDDVGHGTFVAGVAAATAENGIGVAGASMGASVMAVKVADPYGQVWGDAEAAGIIWAADNGANVINLSLGGDTPDQIESDAVAYAVSKGVLVVAAAGNDASSLPQYPAAYPGVVAVGATDAAGNRASFSQYGSWVTVAAPGVNITSTAPTAGSSFFQPAYDTADGTSFSAPLVAAEAALLWSHNRNAKAADVRSAIVSSAHGYAGLGLGAGQVDYTSALQALAPTSVPAVTSPTAGAPVSGLVTVTAASTAPKVRFYADSTPLGAPLATNGGTASMVWSTWGLANGAHTLRAFDCSIKDLCSTDGADVAVTLGNAAPVITAPAPSQLVSGTATFKATAAGGAVAFVVDGVRRGLDTTAPYSLTYPVSALADGTHTVTAVSCSVAGACAGPTSASVSFRNQSLHPRFTAAGPSPFSPNGDGRSDTIKLSFYLPDTETVKYQVRDAAGTIVRGPAGLGTFSAGTRSFVWNGLTNAGARVSSGTYRVELLTAKAVSGATLYGSAAINVRVDQAAPTLSSIVGNGTAFYPYPDAYKDAFSPVFTLNEAATVTLQVRTGAGSIVRTITGSRAAARTSITWNGRNAAGALVGAGTYYWTLTAQDAAGNRRATARYSVTVSSKRLVTKTATLDKRGSQFYTAGGSNDACAWGSLSSSDFRPYGLWLANACDPYYGLEIAAGTYRFTLPAAVSYSSLKVQSYGNSLATSKLAAGFTKWGTSNYAFTPEIYTGTATAWRTLGSVSPTGLVTSSRVVETTVYVPNRYYNSDYDVSHVRLVVTYKVLA